MGSGLGGGEPSGTSRPASKEEAEDLAELRRVISPTETLSVLDEFARWLFASTATVGTVGAGIGLTGAADLDDGGRWLFAVAVACVAISLALACLARVPRRLDVNRYSRESLDSALSELAKRRGNLLYAAGILFAAALLLAGIAPLVQT
jgi:hypothetical protein